MKTKLPYLLVLLCALVVQQASAQQAPQYTQYIFNELVINPAYSGSKDIININTTYRSQWTGLEGAPTTQTLSVDGPARNARMGWGMHLINDRAGAQSQTGAYANIATRINLSRTAQLSLGIAGGISQYVLDGTKLNPGDETPDVAIPEGRESQILPDAKIGLFFNTERYYAGLSVANLIPFKDDNTIIATPRRHYFFSTGYMFDLGPWISLKPSFLIKQDFKGPANLDLNAFLLMYNRVWLGGSYRTAVPMFTDVDMSEIKKRNAWAILAQVYATPKFRIGYSYDVSLTKLRDFSSHEVSLGYSIFKKQNGRTITPRNL
ncbi:type IX secretion system membrane protein PorP/SprF [Pontibacter sp. KCTC 32443]|uniref:PorP/SprF family type IX secretion system membrane protein n=1 Tax=Pontibacter TaxID=323449 RepID=UPI00164E0199|nr:MULTISPECIES: type IX secretion system membrane protein PorP/SprF [Pontibacter]MBC5775745.1 type IX secretion system membrane protein PorP/SprF [Pontibacter sp. KCTC 32443]